MNCSDPEHRGSAGRVGFGGVGGEVSPSASLSVLPADRPVAIPIPGNGSRCSSRDPVMRDGKRVAFIGNQVATMVSYRGPLIREMVHRGMQVFALVPGYTAHDREEIRSFGAEPVNISLNRTSVSLWKDARDLIYLYKILNELQPDVVFNYFFKPIVYGSLAARMAAVPKYYGLIEGAGYVFANEESTDSMRRRFLRWLVTNLCRLSLSRADRVFVLNPDDEALLVQRRMVGAEKIVRIPGIGIDLDHFPAAAAVVSPVTFLLTARLLAEKGIREYVAAARSVKARYPDTRFVLLGGTDQNPGGLSEAEVSRWVDEGVIEWPGFVKDVRPWIRETSVFVLPSYYGEGLPRSIMEAMAMGRPIITTDAPGCRETVVEGENGFLIPTRDRDALSEAMARFVERPELIPRMGRASRRLAEERYDVHRVNAMLLEAMGLSDYAPGATPFPAASR